MRRYDTFKHLILTLICCIGSLSALATPVKLFQSSSKLWTNQHAEGSSSALLWDEKPETAYHTKTDITKDAFLMLTLPSGTLPCKPGQEDLVVYTRRTLGDDVKDHPIGLRVEGSLDNGNTWEVVCYLYFPYRGPGTEEFSARFSPAKPYTHLNFICTANSGKSRSTKGFKMMSMSEFQVYKLLRTDPYPNGANKAAFDDRMTRGTFYQRAMRDFAFENTMGIVDARNRHYNDTIPTWCDWDKNWTADGKWTKAQTLKEEYGITMPDFSLLTSATDPDIAAGQKRQPSHVSEHVVYALPGEILPLYPYYELNAMPHYQENFIHWYDYTNGGHIKYDDGNGNTLRMLDFADPFYVSYSSKYGYFSGSTMNNQKHFYISSKEDWKAFVVNVNNHEQPYLTAELTCDIDFGGETITPLGAASNMPFRGIIEGNGHKLDNFKIETADKAGLIANAAGGCTIRNLTIGPKASVKATTGYGAAALIGSPRRMPGDDLNKPCVITIANCDIQGRVEGIGSVGAFFGNAINTECAAKDADGKVLTDENGNEIKAKVYASFYVTDCHVGGTIIGNSKNTGDHISATVGWPGERSEWTELQMTNVYVTASVTTPNMAGYINDYRYNHRGTITLNNCYSVKVSSLGFAAIPNGNPNGDGLLSALGPQWKKGDNFIVPIPLPALKTSDLVDEGNRKSGTVATFFCPRNPLTPEGHQESLTLPAGKDEYVVAADFSQSFNLDKNLDVRGRKIVEPIIQFRHLFRIRDGKAFADKLSTSYESNQEFIDHNRRFITAPADRQFQIRLETAVPVDKGDPSTYYYMESPDVYRRVCTMHIEVSDYETGKVVDDLDFKFSESIRNEAEYWVGGVKYDVGGSGKQYYRMLSCANPREGRFRVRIFGDDMNGEVVKIYNTSHRLQVMEYVVDFLPASGAGMITEDDLYSKKEYADVRPENMRAAYGDPVDWVDFDEYVALETQDLKDKYLNGSDDKYMYKWPVAWKGSSYGFGYDRRYEYNMYLVTSHSDHVPYHNTMEVLNNGRGLYDRLYYNNKREALDAGDPDPKPAHGYYYYVNAAADPGVMARLTAPKLCLGSTVHVSAWICELSYKCEESANLALNFVAVHDDGSRVRLHTYTTGYVPHDGKDDIGMRGQWLNIFYSFVPDFSAPGLDFDHIDHYELELDNNCKNSHGADYAIDDIYIYIAKPVVYARQMTAVCDDKTTAARVKLSTPFQILCNSINMEEETEKDNSVTAELLYTFIDKKLFDDTYEAELENDAEHAFQTAYDAAVLRFNYSGKDNGKETTYGKLTFQTYYRGNEPDNDTDRVSEAAMRATGDDGERLLVFNTTPSDTKLKSGKEYYIVLKPLYGKEVPQNPDYSYFEFKQNNCAHVSTFNVKTSGVVKIDGEVREDSNNIVCCENQSPIVQVNLLNRDAQEIAKSPYLDWFNGSYEEYLAYGDGLLAKAMEKFRSLYNTAESLGGVVAQPDFLFEQKHIDIIAKALTETSAETGAPLLTLYKSSYAFPPLKGNADGSPKQCYVLAIPIDRTYQGQMVCSQPTEVCINVASKSPLLNHGLRGFTYPDHIADVPLRVGLDQLNLAAVARDGSTTASRRLVIPIRKIVSTDAENIFVMRKIKGKGVLHLASTNDPEYKDIGTVTPGGDESGKLLVIGELADLSADTRRTDNKFEAVFYSDFKFKEGYYYSVRFLYEETPAEGADADPDICDGQDIFTLKVVPLFQKWTGKAGSSWNNDDNWSRVSSDDIYYTEAEAKGIFAPYVTDGSNGRAGSYAPLDFTYTVITPSEANPVLCAMSAVPLNTADYPGMPASAPAAWHPAPQTSLTPGIDAPAPTLDIQYDMAAYIPTGPQPGVLCRPWYGHTCREIDFAPGAELFGQHNLTYQKAWVELRNDSQRWYTLSSPLQTTVAGDMYLPTQGAEQKTHMFEPITFNTKDYNRFKPAVYQRGWSKSSATVYQIDGLTSDNVALKANWSHVYNDVAVRYGAGTGFCIKTDASAVSGRPESVLFRLPKDDTFYDYYSYDGNTTGNHTTIVRDSGKANRLNPEEGEIIALAAKGSKYFLVGNPFMCHLDMKKFLEENAGLVKPKYWMVSAGQQTSAVFTPGGALVGDASGYVAPMQGFFVEALDGAAAPAGADDCILTLTYGPELMASVATHPDMTADEVSIRAAAPQRLTITAGTDGRIISSAMVTLDPGAPAAFDDATAVMALDQSDLDLEATVYTVHDRHAVCISTVPDIEGTEIGLFTPEGSTETINLRFDGELTGGMAYTLYDRLEQSYTTIYPGLEYEVNGPVAGRLYITADAEESDSLPAALAIGMETGRALISNPQALPTRVRAYDLSGQCVADITDSEQTFTLSLPTGIYVIEAANDTDRTVAKLAIR